MAYTGISIVIPAYNEGKYITATLEAAQTSCVEFTKAYGLHAEILVVNNASTDDTETVVRQLNARVVNHSLRNISSVRNAGIREARHDLIVTIDADSFLPRDALIKIWERMLDSGCVGGCLGVRVLTQSFGMKIGAFVVQHLVAQVSGISGAMFFFSRTAALQIGGFPETHLVAEDSAFAIAMRVYGKKTGTKFVRLKSVEVTTLDRKRVSFKTYLSAFTQAAVAFLGFKQNIKDLKYWYDPDR